MHCFCLMNSARGAGQKKKKGKKKKEEEEETQKMNAGRGIQTFT